MQATYRDKEVTAEDETRLGALSIRYQIAEKLRVHVQAQMQEVQNEIAKISAEFDIERKERGLISYEDGAMVCEFPESTSVSQDKKRQDELFEWLKSNGHGGIVKKLEGEKVEPASLRKVVLALVESGVATPPGVEVRTETRVDLKYKKEA